MMVTLLARFNGVDTNIGEAWYEASPMLAVENGKYDGTNLNQSQTREHLATMLYRYADSPAVTDWAADAMP